MSFGAMAAWQAWLLLIAAAAAAVWLFRLKVRPPRVAVPSLLLWRRVFDQPREITWWERIRRAVSLAATAFIALALALAVTRPGPAAAGGTRGRVLIVLDSSWSMLAETAGGATRWDRAVEIARRLAASAGGDEIALATTAEGLVEGPTSDLALIETAIGTLRPSGGEEAAWPRIGGSAAVHFVTDGAIARPLDPGVAVHSVYEPAANVAITAFEARPAAMPSGSHEAYLEVANFADVPQQVRVVVTRGTDVLTDTPVDMAPGEAVRQTFTLGRGAARLRARVSAPRDALAIDDEAVAWFDGAEPVSVTVVSAEPGALGLLLERHAGVDARYVAPGRYGPDESDVLIFDGWLPADPPGKPLLVLSPPTSPWLGERLSEERDPLWSRGGWHPVLAGVDPRTLQITRAIGYRGPSLATEAASARGTPLALVADTPELRAVVLTVTLADSNLAFSPAFPVLIGDAIAWLARPAVETTGRPGLIAVPASATRVTAPDGAEVPLVDAGDRRVARLPGPGLYLVESGGARSVVAANVGGGDVSNLGRTSLEAGVVAAGAGAVGSGRTWWVYAVVAAFVLAAVEWWTWQRRITV
jgi:hypothetical protein